MRDDEHRSLAAHRHVRPRLTTFWSTDWSLTILLIALVLTIFVLFPVGQVGSIGHLVVGAFFSFVLISGAFAVAKNYFIAVLAGGVALASVLIHWAEIALGRPSLDWIDSIFSLASITILAAVVLAQVFREGPITLQRIQGAVVVYLLIGMGWALAYRIVELHDPNAFRFDAPQTPIRQGGLSGILLYFSFTTLTTLGYGDVLAVHPFARALAILEALVGQLFPTILIARLVSMEILYQQDRGLRKPSGTSQH